MKSVRWVGVAVAVAVLAVGLAAQRTAAQSERPPSGQVYSTPGYERVTKVFQIVDRDGRPWVAKETVGIRLNQTAVTDLDLPGPIVLDNGREYPLADPSFVNKFDSRRVRGKATIELEVAAPKDAAETLPYELQFFRPNGKPVGGIISFPVTAEGISLRNPLVVPTHTQPTSRAWLLTIGGFILFLGLVTFGVYRPFYAWRLSRGGQVERSRDWAFFWWWFLTLGGYAALLWYALPRSIPSWIVSGLLGLILIIRLIMCLRPTATFDQEESA